MSSISVAFLDPLHPNIESTVRQRLPVNWRPVFAASRKLEDQKRAFVDADIAFVIGMPVPVNLLDQGKKVRFIQKLGSGVDKIDLVACAQRGIRVARITGGNAIPVAEHALLLILATLRRLPLIDRRTRIGEWLKEDSRGVHRQIHGRNVGIVGFGAIGRTLAGLLCGFAANVAYYDTVQASPEVERELSVTRLGLDQLIEQSDILSLHLPLTPNTRHLISAERIALMKKGSVIVNCARGGLIDEIALLESLQSGHLLGAGLDVFEHEPPVGNPLLQSEATIVTPHMAGATLDNFISVLDRGIANALLFLTKGELPTLDDVYV